MPQGVVERAFASTPRRDAGSARPGQRRGMGDRWMTRILQSPGHLGGAPAVLGLRDTDRPPGRESGRAPLRLARAENHRIAMRTPTVIELTRGTAHPVAPPPPVTVGDGEAAS